MPPPLDILCHRSSAARSFILPTLRALHLDPYHDGCQPRTYEEEWISSIQEFLKRAAKYLIA
jgi:hypothetical protein